MNTTNTKCKTCGHSYDSRIIGCPNFIEHYWIRKKKQRKNKENFAPKHKEENNNALFPM
jgi:hypothetical protein